MDNSTSGENTSSTDGNPFKWQETYLTYAIIMSLVMMVGFLGNLVTLLVLRYPEHRKNVINPLMINLAVADLIITVLIYPVSVTTNLLGRPLQEGSFRCMWSSFANGAAGIASIATLTAMSGCMYYAIKQAFIPHPKIQSRYMALLIIGTWLYGILLNLPPVIGWCKAVPGKAGISCAPDWTTTDPKGIVYIVFLIVFGFLLPLMMIVSFHYLIYRHIRQVPQPDNSRIQASRRRSQMKLVRMTSMTIAAFLLSWAPYCVVSIAALVSGRHVLSSGEAEIPELMAKASVIYNPVVYVVMNNAYRKLLRKMLSCYNDPAVPSSHVNSFLIKTNQDDTAV